jgi:hypothetical protein
MPGPLRLATTLDGYPAGGFGDRYVSVVDHLGPASYVVLTNGTPPTGGDSITAAEAGLKALSAVFAVGLSDNGQYMALVSPGIGGKAEPTSFFISYFVRAGGAAWIEVAGAVNLSARTFRFFCIGR